MKNNFIRFALIAFVLGTIGAAGLDAQNTTGSYVVDIGPNNPADPNGEDYIRERTNPNPILQFTVTRTTSGQDDLTYVQGYSIGSNNIPVAQVSAMQLWKDANGDAMVDAGDTLLANDDLSKFNYPGLSGWGEYNFQGFTLPVDSYGVTLLVTLSLKVTVSQLRTFAMQTNGFKFANGYGTLTGASQYSSYFYTLSSYSGVDLWQSPAVPAAVAVQGSTGHPIMQFYVSPEVDGGYAPMVTKIRVRGDSTVGHTAVAADVTQVRLYREFYSANGVVDAHDSYVATGVSISGTFSWEFTISVTLTDTANFLVVADIGTNPSGIGHVFRMSVLRSEITNNGSILATGGMTSVLEDAQTIKAAVADNLAIVTQPTDTTAGSALGGAAGIRVEARKGATLDTTYTSAVYAEIVTGTGGFTTLSSTAVQAISGVATFTGLSIGVVGSYTIRFVSAPLPPSPASNSFSITAGPAYRVVITKQPSDGVVGIAVPPPPVVEVHDFYDNLVTSFSNRVTATLVSNPSGATLQNNQVFAVNGVATFSTLMVDKASSGYSLTFTAAGIAASGASASFAMAVGAPAQLVLTQQPGGVTGGAIIMPSPRLQVLDAGGNLVDDFVGNVTASIGNNPAGGTLSGTLSVPASGGVATFSDLSINLAGVGYTLAFSANGGSATGTSMAFDITVGAAVKLAITSQPADTTGGMPFSPLVVVQVQDFGGNVIASDSTTTVTASITAGTGETGAALWGTVTLQVVAGVATFPDLAVNKCGPTPYTLTFDSSGPHTAAISNAFTISLGPVARVGLTTEPGLASYGAVFMQQPVAQIQDLGGNLIASSNANISVSIKTGTGTVGAMLGGTTSMFALNGQVTFTNLAIDFAGVDYVLQFASSGLNNGYSLPFNVASPATHLSITVQPGQGQVGMALIVQPGIEIRDAAETLVPDYFTLVTAEIAPTTGTPGALLVGTTQITATAGAAAFTNLQVDRPGKGYRLKFTCYPALTQAISDPFDVAGIPVKLNIARQLVGGNFAGEPLTVQPMVEVCDANDVRCIGENSIVINAYITPATGTTHAILSGTNPLTVVAGLATFTDLAIDRPGASYTLSFSSTPSLYAVHSTAFDIVGDLPPTQNSENEVVGGVDGGNCAAQSQTFVPWMLLGAVALVPLMRRRRIS